MGSGFMVHPSPARVAETKAWDEGTHQVGGCQGVSPITPRANCACRASLRLKIRTGARARASGVTPRAKCRAWKAGVQVAT